MDAGRTTRKYPGYTTAELKLSVLKHEEGRITLPADQLRALKAEIASREARG